MIPNTVGDVPEAPKRRRLTLPGIKFGSDICTDTVTGVEVATLIVLGKTVGAAIVGVVDAAKFALSNEGGGLGRRVELSLGRAWF